MLTQHDLEQLVFQKPNLCGIQRFTQDSPVLPDVWFAYAEPFLPDKEAERRRRKRGKHAKLLQAGDPVDLLLNPHRQSSTVDLYRAVRSQLPQEQAGGEGTSQLTYNESFVVVRLRFDELVRIILPMTDWWIKAVWRGKAGQGISASALVQALDEAEKVEKEGFPEGSEACKLDAGASADLVWIVRLVGRLAWEQARPTSVPSPSQPSNQDLAAAFLHVLAKPSLSPPAAQLWSVSLNRPVEMALRDSVLSTKADAAWRLFDLKAEGIRWAVVDGGIDARHPAFRRRYAPASPDAPAEEQAVPNGKPALKVGEPYRNAFEPNKQTGRYENRTRIVATYDFSRLRKILCINSADDRPGRDQLEESVAYRTLDPEDKERALDYRDALTSGRLIDWGLTGSMLSVPHRNVEYLPPRQPHGTHVAGILAADWHAGDNPGPPQDVAPHSPRRDLHGMCPDLELYDFRVLNEDGVGHEYDVLAALQFIRWLNANKDEPVIHGVNISLSLPHDMANFACGQTPICEECERLVNSGVVVVVAAGNEGQAEYNTTDGGITTGYRGISITDPGNAEAVITVGATHRFKPHTYGVSYFSSRGPTGDGRCKPDLVAPGEKIISCIPGGETAEMDGTSMAAPHVSGAAALLLARHRELMSRPARVKEILCQTATDLGRERFFQGHGMVDVLRAIQSV